MTDQRPIGSGFGAATTAAEVAAGLDLTGKVAIVTGGYSGIGTPTAKVLADAGAEIIVPARDADRARGALGDHPRIEVETLELMDPASIDAFASRFLASGRPLHLLVNSAGIMAPPLARDGRGYESQFSTNHLGHFQLAARLWPALRRAKGARVVAVASKAHQRGPIDLADLNFEQRDYDPWAAYSQSKTANVLFALALDARGQGDSVRAFSLHPGDIVTNLARFLPWESVRAYGLVDAEDRPIIDPASGRKSPEQGAATVVWCATSPQLDGLGGVYCEDCDIAPVATEGAGLRPWGTDREAAERLWTLSEQLTGVRFDGEKT